MTNVKKQRKRSPKYPIISLPEAIERAQTIYKKEGRNSVKREIAVEHWGYNGLNGKNLQLLSSLAQYGLIHNEKGHIRLSDDGFTILQAPDDSIEKKDAVKRCAFSPPVFQDINEKYPDSEQSDSNMKWFLQQNGFNETAAEITIQSFKETISFANVYEGEYNRGDVQIENKKDQKESPMLTKTQNQVKSLQNQVLWTFPFGSKTASLSIEGGKPIKGEMESLIKVLQAFKETLPTKKEDE